MKMARILAILLVVAMMVSVVGCGNTTQNGENSNVTDANISNKNDGFFGKLFGKDEYVDEDYEPDMEGLVGIAVYEVPKGEDYPFEVGQKLLKSEQIYYGFNKWEKFYFNFVSDGFSMRKSKNVSFEETWEGDKRFISAVCSASRDQLYWGYVYQTEVGGEYYIVATNDLVNFDENNSANKTMDIEGTQVSFTVTYNK